MMRRAFLGCLIALCACREADEPSQTIVWIDAERGAQDALKQVVVQAIGPSNNRLPVQEAHDPSWPIKLVLAPKDGDTSRRFTIDIEGRDAQDKTIATFRFKTGFVAGETRSAKLLIHEACVMAAATGCGGSDACNEWMFDVSAERLGRGERDPFVVNARCDASAPSEPGVTEVPVGDKTDPIKEPPTAGASVPVAGTGGTVGTAIGAATTAGSAAPVGTSQQSPDCPVGHLGTPPNCVDINECETDRPCGDHGACENKTGGYACTCEDGFEFKTNTCLAIDHCQTGNGGCEGTCTDSVAGAVCTCAADESLKADRKACGKLSPAKRIDYLASKAPTEPHFAFDGAGNGIAIWVYSDGTNSSLWTRRYVAGTGWTGLPSKLATPEDAGQPGSPRIALDSKGAGVVVWAQTLDSQTDIWAIRWNGTSFGTPEKINDADTGSGYEPTIALDVQGNGFAAWTAFDGSTSRVWIDRFRADTGWSTPLPAVTASGAAAFVPRLSLDALGNATVAWTQAVFPETPDGGMPQPPEATVWAVRFDAKLGRWRLPALQLDSSGAAGLPDAKMFGTDGTSVAIWTRVTNNRVTIQASRFDAAAVRWSSSANIAKGDFAVNWTSTFVSSPRVALSSSGRGAAIWVQAATGGGQIWGNQFEAAADAWTGAKQIRAFSASETVYPQIAVDSAGDGFAVWSEIQGTARTNWVTRLQADGGFADSVELSSDTTAENPDNSVAQVSVDELGNAVVVWDVWSADTYETWASVFE